MPLNDSATCVWGPQTLRTNREWTISPSWTPPASEIPDPRQTPSIDLQVMLAGYVQPTSHSDPSKGVECYVVADLANTTVSPGSPIRDDRENRGWFTHAIDLSMAFEPDSTYAVDVDTPPSSAASGSGSSSSGTSESIGFFGTQLTATGSTTTSQGGSRSYQDFEVTNKTTHGTGKEAVHHHIGLSLCDNGPYTYPFSLVGADGYLAGLPPRAVGNNPLTSAASFFTSLPSKQRPAKATLTLDFSLWFAIVFWQDGPYGSQLIQGGPQNFSMTATGLQTGIWMYWTGSYTGAAACWKDSWSIDVDFSGGQVAWK